MGFTYIPPVLPPVVGEQVFPMDMQHVNSMKVVKGDVQNKGRCHFVGYAATIGSVADIKAAYTKVKRENANAFHVACAFRLPGVDFPSLQGVVDDGEHGAG